MTLRLASSSFEPSDSSSGTTEPLSFRRAPQQVENMAEHGVPFTRIEDAIDATSFVASHKSSLWLLAWSLRDPAIQRQEAREMAGAIASKQQRPRSLRPCQAVDPPAGA